MTARLVVVMVPPTFSVTLPPESSESVLVPAGVTAAEIVMLPLLLRPTRKLPAVMVSISASVSPKVPAVLVPRSMARPALFGWSVAMAAPAVVVPVKVVSSAV